MLYQEQLEKMRAEIATAEKQRKQQSKAVRQHSSFTLPRLRSAFSRKSQSLPQDDAPLSAAVVADDQKSRKPTIAQRVSVSDE